MTDELIDLNTLWFTYWKSAQTKLHYPFCMLLVNMIGCGMGTGSMHKSSWVIPEGQESWRYCCWRTAYVKVVVGQNNYKGIGTIYESIHHMYRVFSKESRSVTFCSDH